jgi:hypothetical protein
MNLQEIIDTLELTPFTQPKDYSEFIPSAAILRLIELCHGWRSKEIPLGHPSSTR